MMEMMYEKSPVIYKLEFLLTAIKQNKVYYVTSAKFTLAKRGPLEYTTFQKFGTGKIFKKFLK